MNSKDFLKLSSSSLVLGSSLASLVGTANVNAQGPWSSIKNFFLKNKTENEEKKLSLKERKERYNWKGIASQGDPCIRAALCAFFGAAFSFAHADSVIFMKEQAMNYSGYYTHPIAHAAGIRALKAGLIITALISAGVGFYSYYKRKNSIKKGFEELRKYIKEDLLEKQWDLKKFQKMLEDEDQCKKFLEQLLVLEPSSSESGNNEKNVPHLNQGDLNEKVQAFKELFTEEPEKLRDNNKKEIYKELITNLSDWCGGIMKRLYDPGKKNYFTEQNDIELVSRIVLLRKIVLGEEVDYQQKITNLTVKDFNKSIKDEDIKNFRKLLLLDIRDYISEHDANDEAIIKILTKLTEPGEMRQPMDYYYEKIKTFFEEEFKDKQKRNRVLLGLKNFSNKESLYDGIIEYHIKF